MLLLLLLRTGQSDILNNGLNNYIAQSLSNSGGVNPLDVRVCLPPVLA